MFLTTKVTQNKVLVIFSKAFMNDPLLIHDTDNLIYLDRTFNQKSHTYTHLERRHARPTNEVCANCEKVFKNKPSLRIHLAKKTCLKRTPDIVIDS